MNSPSQTNTSQKEEPEEAEAMSDPPATECTEAQLVDRGRIWHGFGCTGCAENCGWGAHRADDHRKFGHMGSTIPGPLPTHRRLPTPSPIYPYQRQHEASSVASSPRLSRFNDSPPFCNLYPFEEQVRQCWKLFSKMSESKDGGYTVPANALLPYLSDAVAESIELRDNTRDSASFCRRLTDYKHIWEDSHLTLKCYPRNHSIPFEASAFADVVGKCASLKLQLLQSRWTGATLGDERFGSCESIHIQACGGGISMEAVASYLVSGAMKKGRTTSRKLIIRPLVVLAHELAFYAPSDLKKLIEQRLAGPFTYALVWSPALDSDSWEQLVPSFELELHLHCVGAAMDESEVDSFLLIATYDGRARRGTFSVERKGGMRNKNGGWEWNRYRIRATYN